MNRVHVVREEGTSTLEFALVALVLFTFIFGIIEIGRVIYLQHEVNAVALEVARVVGGEPFLSDDEARRWAQSRVTLLDPGALTVTISRSQTRREVTVSVSYPYSPVVPLVFNRGWTLQTNVVFHY